MTSSFCGFHRDETAQVNAQLKFSLACILSEPPMPNGEREEYVVLSQQDIGGN
jgi:hypothetical protein